ncbi:MAG: oligosaccharide flippase family protein [Aliifodinibius sp.]|nr:polysaccharide biosynthesis protein [Fodinibius sp.]NIV15977.1 oligosaccharide flippase family protein [Fodinibius sp.]NIY29946.1 oligosaccharide flippase family protein [Fodinibius sp.]
MSTTYTFIRNVSSNYATFFISILIAFFLSPFIIHSLGNTAYGLWVLVGSICGYFGVLNLGFPTTIIKYISHHHALGEYSKINEIINTMLLFFSLIGVVVILIAAVFAPFAHNLFNVQADYISKLRIIILLLGINVAISFPLNVFDAIFRGLQRFDVANIIRIIVIILRAGAIVLFLKAGGGLIALATITLIMAALECTIKATMCKRVFPQQKIDLRIADIKLLKQLVGFSLYMFIIAVSVQISFMSDSIVIGIFLTAEAITFFAIGANLVFYLRQFITQISAVITPIASAFGAKQDSDRMKRLLFTGTRYCFMAVLPISVIYLILGETFIALWIGPEYGPKSSQVLSILTWSYIIFLSQFVAGSIFIGLGKVKVLAFLHLGAAVSNILISILLVNKYGITGVAFGTAIPLLIQGTFILPIYVCRTLKVSIVKYFLESYIPPLLSSIPFIIAVLLARYFMTINSLTVFMIYAATLMIIYIIFEFGFAFENQHRKQILEKLRFNI